MSEAIANPCPICGKQIPHKPRVPMKTCSPECRKERHRRLEKVRYHQVKARPEWRAARAEYLAKLRHLLAADPEFAAIFRAHAAQRTRLWAEKVRTENPDRYARLLAARRAERAEWRTQLAADPDAWEAHKARCRAWYHGLSAAEKKRIFSPDIEVAMKKQMGRPKFDWTPGKVALLGTKRDAELAVEWGCSPDHIARKRRELGVLLEGSARSKAQARIAPGSITIESGVPMPPPKIPAAVYPFSSMSPGDSFFAPGVQAAKSIRTSIVKQQRTKGLEGKFFIKSREESGIVGARCWRVE